MRYMTLGVSFADLWSRRWMMIMLDDSEIDAASSCLIDFLFLFILTGFTTIQLGYNHNCPQIGLLFQHSMRHRRTV